MSLDEKLGMSIKNLRLKRNISGAQIAQELGISPQQFSKYELGKNRMSASCLLRILTYMGNTIQDCGFFDSIDQYVIQSYFTNNDMYEASSKKKRKRLNAMCQKLDCWVLNGKNERIKKI